MTLDEVYQCFGSIAKAARAINVPRGTFYYWIKKGVIPPAYQERYEKLVKNLKADPIRAPESSFPRFIFFNKELGMCEVYSLTYIMDKVRITYYDPANPKIKYSSFESKYLMQECDFMGNIFSGEKNE